MINTLRRSARNLVLPLRRGFRRSIENPNQPLSFDMGSDSTTLLVAFGGMAGQIGMPPFEFFKATGEIPVKRLFVRDLHQAWYHRGIPGHGDTFEEAAASLRALIAERNVERLVVAGNSAGGYAALAFGTLLAAETALCFAPQTVLELDTLAEWQDSRWDDQLQELVAAGAMDSHWTDLRPALLERGGGATRYEIYFDETLDVDRLHAEQLAGIEGVRLHRLRGGAHSVALEMRENGELERVLRRALMPGSVA
jgi:pimeloyl-ACP methyl ester carboxylesterase